MCDLHSKIESRKVKICQFVSENGLDQHKCTVCMAGKCHSNTVHLQKRIVIISIGLLISVSDWDIIKIGLGGLLLVIPRLFAAPVFVLLVGLQENK
jgi:hypothetical protein